MRESIKLWNELLSCGCLPNDFTFATMVDGYCRQGRLEQALELCSKMWKEGLRPDVVTCSALLNGLCKSGRIQETKDLLSKMSRSGLANDAITYILIKVYCREVNSQEVSQLLDLMVGERFSA